MIENAIIKSTALGIEAVRYLTAWLYLEGEGWGQGYGGFALTDKAAHVCIEGVLKTLRVEKWEDLPGKAIRFKRDEPFGDISAIGHIVEDRWFEPEKAFAKLRAELEEE